MIGLLASLFSLAGYRYFFQNPREAPRQVALFEAEAEAETAPEPEEPPISQGDEEALPEPPPAEAPAEEEISSDVPQVRTEPLRVQAGPRSGEPQELRKPALRLKPAPKELKARVVVRPEDLESEPAVLLAAPSASYPAAARGTETSAEVIVGFTIDETGAVRNPSIESARVQGEAPEALFEEAALAAARQARFEPAREQGTPTISWGTLTFSFESGTRPAGS